MNFNFELILFCAVFITGFFSFIDIVFFERKRNLKYTAATKHLINPPPVKLPFVFEYSRSFFSVLLIVFLIRSFLYEPYRIPSGSLEPTLDIGDFIVVNKSIYGLRLPVIHKRIIKVKSPQRGDIMVFRWPVDPKIAFIKRVIGLPGDRISYTNKVLTVNGIIAPQVDLHISEIMDDVPGAVEQTVIKKEEYLVGVKHYIYQNPLNSAEDIYDLEVPPGMYFVMGDNRDDSEDSRFWGFVPDQNIIGRADMVWMSWNAKKHGVRFSRIGTRIH
jgi:signal peptidase I